MNNMYKGPIIKLIAKVILTGLVCGVASGLAQRIWR